MKKAVILFILNSIFLFFVISLYSQVNVGHNFSSPSYTPATPNGGAIGGSGHVNVNHYTGTPRITIPLYTLEARGISLPISLVYNGSGVRIDDIASPVGLGWSLAAGGAMYRGINGLDDMREEVTSMACADFYPSQSGGWIRGGASPHNIWLPPDSILPDCIFDGVDHTNYVGDALVGNEDTRADYFAYSISNGFGGAFFAQRDPVQDIFYHAGKPNNSISVKYHYTLNAHEQWYAWQIIGEDGTEYQFGNGCGSDHTAQDVESDPVNGNTASDYAGNGITTWHLKRIITTLNDTLFFEYDDYNWEYVASKWQARRAFVDTIYRVDPENNNFQLCGDPNDPYGEEEIPTPLKDRNVEIEGKVLKKIVYKHTEVFFYYSNNRCDIDQGGKRLDSIKVVVNGEVYKKFKLDYVCQSDKKRMWLKWVYEIGADGTELPPYEAFYHKKSDLPPRLSTAQDHWGYYNDNISTGMIPPNSSYSCK